MTPERWSQVEAVLDEALDLPTAERTAFLRERCAGDDELRGEVETLLGACDAAQTLFEPPMLVAREAVGAPPPRTESVTPGQMIGAWRVIRLLGRGGMGSVYLAERADGVFEKQVALKVVKRGMDTDEILDRFRHERQILARLQHPNIAGLLDAGATSDGLPYFVMELADGQPIDAYCDEHRLSIEQRLQHFRTICDAVQYAHRNLVVHRDLKPSNILVADGVVKLLDFGIAKVLETGEVGATAMTSLYAPRLTPEYAAPEQVRGEPTTTATDVYALGVILYELLSGRAPYRLEQRNLSSLEQVICHEVPRHPSTAAVRDGGAGERIAAIAEARATRPPTLRQTLSGDLDAICLKALNKEPERRYKSAAEMAEDIERHLAGRPVEAQPDSRWYRAKKFVRRNRKTVTLATAAILALIIGTITTATQAYIARTESAQRQVEAERASLARDFLISMLAGFDPDRMGGERLGNDRVFSFDELIASGVANLDSLSVRPELKAGVMNTLAQIVFNAGDRVRADSLFSTALELLGRQRENPDIAISMMGIGEVKRRDQQFAEAVAWFRRALAVRRRTMAADDTHIAETMSALAFALYNMGRDSTVAEAENLYNQLLAFPSRLPARIRASALEGLGDVRLGRRNPRAADSLYREAISIRTDALGADHPDNARGRWGLAIAVATEGNLVAAERLYREALSMLRAAYTDEHRDVALARYNLGYFLYVNGRYAEAEEELCHAAQISARVNAPNHEYTGTSWETCGLAQLAEGRLDEAIRSFEQSREVYRRMANTPGRETDGRQYVTSADAHLGQALIRAGRWDEARRAYSEAWRHAIDDTQRAEVATQTADMFQQQGRADSAQAWRTTAVSLRPAG